MSHNKKRGVNSMFMNFIIADFKILIHNTLFDGDYYLNLINRDLMDDFNKILFTWTIFVFILVIMYNTYMNYVDIELLMPSLQETSDTIHKSIHGVFGAWDRFHNRPDRYPINDGENAFDITLQDRANELMYVLDKDGNFLYANDKTLLEFHSNLKDILGESIFYIYKKLGSIDFSWFETLKNQKQSNSLVKISLNGIERLFFINYKSTFDSKGNLETIVANGNDISFLSDPDKIKEFYSDKDPLTGLTNQYGLFEYIKNLNDVDVAAIFMIQALHFSEILNYYGHQVGDKLINAIVDDLKMIVSEKCLIVRYTESRFLILCTDNQNIFELDNYLQRFKQFTNSSYDIGDLSLQIDKKIGYAIFPEDTNSIDELVSLASLALKESIVQSSYTIMRFNEEMKDNLNYNVEVANRLRKAIDNNLIQVYFQKVIDCNTNKIFVIEELSRWNDEKFGYIPPVDFFRVAKETNQLNRLDRYMVSKSIEAFEKLHITQEFSGAKLTINISPYTLLDINFFEYFDNLVSKSNIKPNEVYIEISETTFVNNIDICLARINQYKEKGYLIALDDFGVEYSSLSILESVNFDMIKIDAHFVRNIDKFSNQEIIKMIRTITEKNSKEIVAEGVETEEQSLALKSLGCQMQQGYYHHKPENLSIF